MEQEEEIICRSGVGEIIVYVKIGQKEIIFCYVENMIEVQIVDGMFVFVLFLFVEKLEKQDECNKEIVFECMVEDIKKQIFEVDIMGGKFSVDEDIMLYFFFLFLF